MDNNWYTSPSAMFGSSMKLTNLLYGTQRCRLQCTGILRDCSFARSWIEKWGSLAHGWNEWVPSVCSLLVDVLKTRDSMPLRVINLIAFHRLHVSMELITDPLGVSQKRQAEFLLEEIEENVGEDFTRILTRPFSASCIRMSGICVEFLESLDGSSYFYAIIQLWTKR